MILVGQSVRRVVRMSTNSAPTRNSPETRSVQAADASSATAHHWLARARSQAQKAAAQNSDSV